MKKKVLEVTMDIKGKVVYIYLWAEEYASFPS